MRSSDMEPDNPVRYWLELKAKEGHGGVEVMVFKSLGDHFIREGHQSYRRQPRCHFEMIGDNVWSAAGLQEV